MPPPRIRAQVEKQDTSFLTSSMADYRARRVRANVCSSLPCHTRMVQRGGGAHTAGSGGGEGYTLLAGDADCERSASAIYTYTCIYT